MGFWGLGFRVSGARVLDPWVSREPLGLVAAGPLAEPQGVRGFGFRVLGFGFGVLGFWGLGFWGVGFWGVGCWGFGVWGFGYARNLHKTHP